MRSTSTTLLPESSLEESALTSIRVDHFFLRVKEKNPASQWRASMESANLALVRMYDFLPRADEEPTSSMERRGRRTGAAYWDGSSSSPQNLTLLAGAADNTEEDGRGLLLAEAPTRVAGHTCDGDEAATDMRKGIKGGRQGGAFIKKGSDAQMIR
jgi:hypothetical protein